MLTRISEQAAKQLLDEPIYIRQKVFADPNGTQRVKISRCGRYIRHVHHRFIILLQPYYYYSPRDYTNTYLQRGQWDAQNQRPMRETVHANTLPIIQLTSHDILSSVQHLKLYALPDHARAKYGQLTFFAKEETAVSLEDKLQTLQQKYNILCFNTSATLDPIDRKEIVRYIFGDHTIIARI